LFSWHVSKLGKVKYNKVILKLLKNQDVQNPLLIKDEVTRPKKELALYGATQVP
jgi:hypothetical protein